MDLQEGAQQIIQVAKDFHQRGWCLATSGNFSVRLSPQEFLITASGKDKGSLNETDFVQINLQNLGNDVVRASRPPASATADAPLHDYGEASAETKIHREIYLIYPEVHAVLHVHSPYATVVSMCGKNEIVLEDYEMLKALPNVSTHKHREVVPVFPNSQDVQQIAAEAKKYLPSHPDVRAFLLFGHGLYTWATDLGQATRNVEAFEFLLECEYLRNIIKMYPRNQEQLP